MEGDLGAGSSSSPSTPALPPPSLSADQQQQQQLLPVISKMAAAEETSSTTTNSNSNGLWGSLLERSSTAPPTEFEAWGTSTAAATGPDHGAGGSSSSASGNNSTGGGLLLGAARSSGALGGGAGAVVSAVSGGHIIPPSRPKTTEPSLHFIDEYSHSHGGGSAGSASASPARNAAGMNRLPPGLAGSGNGSAASSGNLAVSAANAGGAVNDSSANAMSALERQFLFETGSGIRRPASTGIILGGGGGGVGGNDSGNIGGDASGAGNNNDSLTLMSGVASAEVLKSLGLEIPGYTHHTHSSGNASGAAAPNGGNVNDSGAGSGAGSSDNAPAASEARRSSLGTAGGNGGRGTPSSKSGSALMDLIQEEMRSGRASAVTPALDIGESHSRSASTAPPPPPQPGNAGNGNPSVDEISAGLQGMQVGTGAGSGNANAATKNQIRYEPVASASHHSNNQSSQYQQQQPHNAYQQHQQHQHQHQHHQQQAIYHQPSPVFTGMSHNSPPEFYLGGGGGAPVSPHGHQMYGHQPPSAVAAAGQYGHPSFQPQQQQVQPQQQHQVQQPTVYYTQGPNGQTQAVYVNAPPPPPPTHAQYGMAVPPPPPPPPHGYGYATIQYHAGPPPGQHQHQHQGGHPHQHQQVIHVNANGQPIAAQAAAQPTAYAYYPSTGQYAPVTTATTTATASGGQQVVLAAAPPGGIGGYPHQHVVGIGNNGGGSPRRHQNQGLGGSRHGRHGGRSNGGYSGRGMDGSGHSGGGGGGRHRANTGGSAASGPTNPMLEEFRNNKSSASTWTVADIRGHVVDFCRDQNGSRFIQQRLEVAPQSEKDLVMEEVVAASGGGLTALCGDVFGNYVVQKLLEVGDDKMLEDIMKSALQGEMMNLSMQMYGCRVVQKSFEMLPCKHFPALLDEFKNDVVACIHDANGNHVMQKIVESLSNKAKIALKNGDATTGNFFRDCIQFIIDDILKNIAPLSCHPYGCRVLQRILEHCVEPQKSDILDALLTCHKVLLDDQYGNYVIQHVLQYGRVQDRQSLLGIIVAGGILTLSRQKFASNVVEKLLKYGNQEQRAGVVRAMLETVHDDSIPSVSPGGTPIVILMVRDAYANYVVQTAIDVSVDPERRELLNVLNANVMMLRQYTFAKHIVAKLGA